MYITALEYVSRFGLLETSKLATPDRSDIVTTELLKLTIDDGDRSAYTPEEIEIADETLAVIELAISYSTKEINSYLTVAYNLPLETSVINDNPIKGLCGDITRYRIANTHPTEEIVERYNNAIKWLEGIASGIIKLLTDSDSDDNINKVSLSVMPISTNYNFDYY